MSVFGCGQYRNHCYAARRRSEANASLSQLLADWFGGILALVSTARFRPKAIYGLGAEADRSVTGVSIRFLAAQAAQ